MYCCVCRIGVKSLGALNPGHATYNRGFPSHPYHNREVGTPAFNSCPSVCRSKLFFLSLSSLYIKSCRRSIGEKSHLPLYQALHISTISTVCIFDLLLSCSRSQSWPGSDQNIRSPKSSTTPTHEKACFSTSAVSAHDQTPTRSTSLKNQTYTKSTSLRNSTQPFKPLHRTNRP